MTVAQSFVDAYAPHGPYVSPCSHASTSTHANVTGAVAPGPRRHTSPRRRMRSVAGDIDTDPRATATRSVRGFSPTSIIRTAPPGSVDALLAQEALGVDGRHAARSGRRHRLAVVRVGHVAGGEDPCHGWCGWRAPSR